MPGARADHAAVEPRAPAHPTKVNPSGVGSGGNLDLVNLRELSAAGDLADLVLLGLVLGPRSGRVR